MDVHVAIDERDEDEVEEASLATTMILTANGWEDAGYLEPGDDWTPQSDGSFLSPDGTIRTWPLGAATG
jgi:hypothetical protein